VERADTSLALLVKAVLDGDPIDWASTESSASTPDDRAQVRAFRTLAAVAALHREPESTDPIVGTTAELWGSLRLLERIGAGSFGDVYRAWDRRLDREVALKLLRYPGGGGHVDSGVVDEGRLLARVRHPHVVTVHGADVINGQVGIWMEFVRGRTLEACVRVAGPLEWREAVAVGTTICDALEAVHAAGLVHRDVNAKNVMREDDGRIVLMDFGAGHRATEVRARLIGTPLYLAPELFDGMPANRATDIYSLGVLLYHLVTGSYPLMGRTLDEIREAHRNARRTPLRDGGRDLPAGFVEAIERAIEPNPSKRFGTASALGAALQATLTSVIEQPTEEKPVAEQEAAPPTAKLSGWRATRARIVVGLGLFALMGLVVAALYASIWHARASGGSVGRTATEPGAPSTSLSPAAVPRATEVVEPLRAALQFQGRDWVLIAAFENRTGEAVLDGTLEYALERELSNSSFVNVAPRDRIDDVLRLMKRPIDTKVDARLGREICLRDGGIRALVTGRVEKVAATYVITSQIVNPLNSAVMTSLTEEAGGQAQLLQAVRRQAFRVREVLGEMVSTIQASEAALEKVTTPSLHALQLYSQASAFYHGNNWKSEPAEQLLMQAVAEDPEFASAYILLAHTIHNQGRPADDFIVYAKRAADLAARTSDVERYFILGSYHSLLADTLRGSAQSGVEHSVAVGTRGPAAEEEAERRAAIAAYEALIKIKPDHYWATGNLLRELNVVFPPGHPGTADTYARLADARGGAWANLAAAQSLFNSGDAGRGRRYLRRARTAVSSADSPSLRAAVAFLAAQAALLDRDVVGARRIADEFAHSPESPTYAKITGPDGQTFVWELLAWLYADMGRFGDAHKAAQNQSTGVRERSLLIFGQLIGGPGARDALRDFIGKYLTQFDTPPDRVNHSSYLVQLGMVDELRAYVARNKQDERGTPPSMLAAMEGYLAVGEGHIEEAERRFQAVGWVNASSLALSIADAWKARGEATRAAAVLERLTNNRWPEFALTASGVVRWIRVREPLADLYRAMGRFKEADEIDGDLLKLLAVADADHPVLARIKARQSGS
jgi:serine/threonine-protein kinase